MRNNVPKLRSALGRLPSTALIVNDGPVLGRGLYLLYAPNDGPCRRVVTVAMAPSAYVDAIAEVVSGMSDVLDELEELRKETGFE